MSLLETLRPLGTAQKAAEMAAYHKVPRVYLGVSNPQIDAAVKAYHATHPVSAWVTEARALWETDIFEARIAAGKLLTKARIKQNAPQVWNEIARCVPAFDSWAIADHMSGAAARRLVADPARLDQVEGWAHAPGLWQRRSALVMTLPWAKMAHADADNLARRERILGWAAQISSEPEWFLQKAVGWWLRTLAKKDPARVRAFLDAHGAHMKAFAVREALRPLG